MAAPTLDELAAQLAREGLSAEAWRRWVESDAADAAVIRDVTSATEALVRGRLDRAGYEARMTRLWTYWRDRLDALPPEGAGSGGGGHGAA